jgi:hypothetical protein
MHGKGEGARDLLVSNKNARLLAHIEQSYTLMQQSLRARFPLDDEAAYEEQLDLYEDEWRDLQERRESLYEEAEQFKSLFIDGLRSRPEGQEHPFWRQQMLYRLAGLFELAAVIDPGAVESLASKIDVSYKQGAACAVLKFQADDVQMSRCEIEEDLKGLDAWWHNSHEPLSDRIAQLLTQPLRRFNPFFARE